MMQVIVNCDRCSKLLNTEEGFQINVLPRITRPVLLASSGFRQDDLPYAAELCAGCAEMLHFLFRGKFKESKLAQ